MEVTVAPPGTAALVYVRFGYLEGVMKFRYLRGCRQAATAFFFTLFIQQMALGLPQARVEEPILVDTDAVSTASAVQKPAGDKKGHVNEKYDVTRIGVRHVGSGVNFYSLDRERAFGHELAMEIENNAKLVEDPEIVQYVTQLTQQLVAHSDAKVPFEVKILDNDEVNAFALPGGFLYVNTGLITAAEDEAELAGVLSHEIAHVAARHATKNATRAQIADIATLALGMFGGPTVAVIRQVANFAVPMTFLKFGRNAEREADLLGLEYQYAAGYDPNAMVQFFERMQAQQKKLGFIARTFQTHPMKEERVRRAQEEIARFLPPRPQYIISTSSFEEIRARVERLTGAIRLNRRDRAPELVLRRDRTQEPVPDDPPKQ